MHIVAKQLRNGGQDTGGFAVVYKQDGKRIDLNCSVQTLTNCSWWVRQVIEEPITEKLSAAKLLLEKRKIEKECFIASGSGCKECLLGGKK